MDTNLTYSQWLTLNARLLMGAEGDDDADDDDDDGDGPSGTTGSGSAGSGKSGATGATGAASSEEDDDDEPDNTHVRISVKELEEMRGELNRVRREKKAKERESRVQAEKQRAEQGQYRQLAEDREKERDEAIARSEEIEKEKDSFIRSIRVRDAATRLGFRDASDAIRFLEEVDTENDSSVDRALKKLGEERPYLLAERRPSGRSANGGNGAAGEGMLSLEKIKGMTQAEIIANIDEVNKSMAAQRSVKKA
jgi:hypothetical protein